MHGGIELYHVPSDARPDICMNRDEYNDLRLIVPGYEGNVDGPLA